MFQIVKNRIKGICVAVRCKNKHSKRDRFCSKHSKRFQKYKDEIKYTYHQKKSRAIERGIVFTISLQYFRDFCEETNYMELKGKMASSASIDRKDPLKGYEEGNLQILSLANNTKKMHHDNGDSEVPF